METIISNHIPTISAAARSAIRDHIIESEERKDRPYLDIKGNVTIGVGFKTDAEDEFAKLNLQVFKDGKWVTANGDEKRQAFQQMQEAKEKRSGDFSPKENFYKDKTNIRMAEPDQDALAEACRSILKTGK